jgi:hypothetical protein
MFRPRAAWEAVDRAAVVEVVTAAAEVEAVVEPGRAEVDEMVGLALDVDATAEELALIALDDVDVAADELEPELLDDPLPPPGIA